MKFHLISETIDGSIKDIVQLKTLDSSLEYSQMFDALEDCPKDFQAKLIQALNSVGETIQASPVDVFNIVLCASYDEDDKDSTKKMYNWWKAVFEILSRCDIPDDRKAEYDDLVDTLMAEVSKAGDAAQVNEAEEYGYEQANIEDEEVMLKDMEFAISKIGEIANRVQDLINFVNPYCQSVNEDNMMKFKKINESDDLSNEVVEVTYYLPEDYKDDPDDDSWITTREKLINICGDWFDGEYEMDKQEGEPVYRTSGPEGYTYFKFDNPEDDAKFLEYAEMLRDGNQVNERSGYYSCVDDDIDEVPIGLDDDYFYRSSDRGYEHDYDNDDDNMSPEERKQARQGLREESVSGATDGEWVDMKDLIGVPQTDPADDNRGMRMESDVKEIEGFKVGDKVIWDDPDGEPTDGWTIVDFEFEYPDDDEFDSSIADEVIVDIEKEDGSYAQALLIELEHDEVDDGNPLSELPGPEDIEAMDLGLVDAKDILPKRLQKADEDGSRVESPAAAVKRLNDQFWNSAYGKKTRSANEAQVVQDVNDVWALLKVLEDDEAAKNLKDLIDSHVRTEEEIMDAVDELYPEDVTQTELNNVFASGMEDIVDALGLDVNAYVKDGSFVDLEAPSTIASEDAAEAKPEEVNGDEKKFKGDDGEVKTLDNANKKVVSEMTIEQDINSAEQLERILWGQGKENFIELVSKYGADEVMSVLEDSGITNLTQMNDYLWFEVDSIEEMLGGSSDDEDEEF